MAYEGPMSDVVRQAAEELIRRANASGQIGAPIERGDMDRLIADTEGRIPRWLADPFVSAPLSGLGLGWQADEPAGDFDGVIWLRMSDAGTIRSESLACYPGLAIIDRGFINIASCNEGSGDPYFVCADDGDDPPVYQVYHDVSDQSDAILAHRRRIVAGSLSGFFRSARVEPTRPLSWIHASCVRTVAVGTSSGRGSFDPAIRRCRLSAA